MRRIRLLAGIIFGLLAISRAEAQPVTAFPQASTPLSGSEILYLVQGGVSKQITAGSLLGGSGGAGVSSFNSRTGAISLLSADVTAALGFAPLASNGSGAGLTGITFGQIGSKPTTLAGFGITDGLTQTGNGSGLTGLAYTQLPPLAANQLLGALTATTPSGQPVPSCAGASNALTWTLGVGFGCNTITGGGGGTGTVTSVAMTVPSIMSVSGSPIATAGTLAVSLASETANTVFAAPNGSTGTPTFRLLAPADLPVATTSTLGAVRPDGTTITVTAGGVISAVSGGSGTITGVTAGTGLTGGGTSGNVPISLTTPIASSALPAATASAAGAVTVPASAAVLGSDASSNIVATSTTGTGAVVRSASPTLSAPNLGTPSAATLTNATGLPVGGVAAVAANSVVGNGTGSSATPTALAVPSCASASNALTWTLGAGFGCNTITGGAVIANGHIFGCTLSNDGTTPNTIIDVAACQAANTTNTVLMARGADVLNFATNGADGLDTGTFAASTWYAVLIIQGTNGTAYMATKETAGVAISPTLPSGYSVYRYLGSVQTNSSTQLVAFTQYGNHFYLATKFIALNTSTPATTLTFFTAGTPLGIVTYPIIYDLIAPSSAGLSLVLASPLYGAQSSIQLSGPVTSQNATGSTDTLPTNTSGQLQYSSQGTSTVVVNTLGWIDPHVAPAW